MLGRDEQTPHTWMCPSKTYTLSWAHYINRYKAFPIFLSLSLHHVVNAHLVDDPTIQQPGFTLPRQQWSLLNRFRTGQGHCGVCRKTWCLTDTDLCSCGETQTMYHIVESCPLTKLNGGLSQLHYADDAAIAWLTNHGS